MSRRKSTEFYKTALKMIRKYATGFDASDGYDLRKPLSPSQKGQITRYYDGIQKLVARPVHVYRARNKKNLEIVQKAAQHVEPLPKLKVAFVPSGSHFTPKIRITKSGHVRTIIGGVTKELIYIDPRDLIEYPEESVKQALDSVPHARHFKIMMGEYENRYGTYSRGTVGEEVKKLMARYDANNFNPDDPSSHYFGNWLHGLIAYSYQESQDLTDFQRDMREAKERLKIERQRARQRFAKQQQRAKVKARSEAAKQAAETRKRNKS